MGRINSVISVPTSLDTTFFEYWLTFLKPIHKLGKSDIKLFAAMLKRRFELSDVIADEKLLDEAILGREERKRLKDAYQISSVKMYNCLTALKRSKVIINGRINPKFIPKVKKGDKDFSLLFYFTLK